MDGHNLVNINFDTILDVALKGVRRAAAFMGFGVNAATNPDFNKYQLTDITHIQILPENIPLESVIHMKKHFLTWIVGCGLRELIESYSVFLDRIFLALTQVVVIQDNFPNTVAERNYRHFQHEGISGKLTKLKDVYNIESRCCTQTVLTEGSSKYGW